MKRTVINKENYRVLDEFNWAEFSLDTETSSLKQSELELTGVSLHDGTNNFYIPVHEASDEWFNAKWIVDKLNTFITKESKISYWNFVFDARVLHKYGFDATKNKYFDGMIAYHLINENDEKKSLKHCTRTILGREVAEFDKNLSHYCEEFFNYALDDSLNTWELYKILLPEIIKQDLSYLFFKIEMPFQKVLLEMTIEGVEINQPLLKEYDAKIKEEIMRLEIELHEEIDAKYSLKMDIYGKPLEVVSRINFGSSKQLGEILFDRLGLEVVEYTPKGSRKTGKTTIEKYINNPFVKILEKYKIAKQLYSLFIKKMPEHIESDGKVRPSFKDVGTKTGRLSCSKPNLQQLPKPKEYSPVQIRTLFQAPTGYKMFSCDYSSQEICVAAQISKDKTLVEALNKGWDSHLAVANKSYNLGLSEESLFDGSPEHDVAKKVYKKQRGTAKTINFGLMYGKGAYGFAKDFEIEEEEAQKIVDDYFRDMPQLKQAIDDTHKEVESGSIRSMAGRIRHFNFDDDTPFYIIEKAKRQSFNFKVQGFSADMIRAASINVYARNMNKAWGLKAVMTVHDEFVYIVREEYVDEATALVKKAFEDVGKNFIVPIKADIEVGDNYGNAK